VIGLTSLAALRYKEKMWRRLRWVALIVMTAALLFIGGSYFYALRLTRARQTPVGPPPSDFPYPIETLAIATPDEQTLAAWLVSADDKKKAVILLHGWGGTRKHMLARARFLREQGCTALLYDARACGESTGDAVTFGYRERADLLAALKLLKDRGYERIGCLGVSQGGATICFAADELGGVRCVICESVYDDMTHAVDRRMRYYTGTPGWLGAALIVPFAEQRLALSIDDVKPVDHIAKLRCPVFVISGTNDTRAWPEDALRLFDAAAQPKQMWMVPEAKHEDLFRFPGYQDRLLAFLKAHLD
jgi:pimeloyl-ACP methyl ester carboxylesterase